MTTPATPAQLYLGSLSAGSQGMGQCLDIIAGIMDDNHDAESYPWHEVTYRESMAVRITLTERYKPSTVNKMLSALRGVLKQTWRLVLMDADAYRRAADVENVRNSNLLSVKRGVLGFQPFRPAGPATPLRSRKFGPGASRSRPAEGPRKTPSCS